MTQGNAKPSPDDPQTARPDSETEIEPSGEDAAVEQAEAEAEALQAEIAQVKDQLLRALAETENLRRRSEREREEVAKYAISAFARDVIGVADNLSRALENVPPEARGEDERLQRLGEGVELIRHELDNALERHGIRRIEPLGEPFDHNFHQAMFEVDESDQPPGTVAAVMQAGYLIHDRLLRPAMVGVVKKRPDGGGVDTKA